MPEHPNATVMRNVYEAWGRGDIPALEKLVAEDLAWHIPGRTPIAGTHKGRDAVLAASQKAWELTDYRSKVEVHDAVANEEHSVALTRVTSRRGAKTLDIRGVEVAHMANGVVKEVWSLVEDQRPNDEFWS